MRSPGFSFVLLFTILVGWSSANTGSLPYPDVLANEFYENFTTAINSKNQEAIKRWFAPSFLDNATTYAIYESLSTDLVGFSFSLEHSNYAIHETPKKNTWLLNTTVRFRGPHPTYTRKYYNIILENQNSNSVLYPDQWKIRTVTPKTYARKSFAEAQMAPETIMGNILQEFLNCVNTRDIRRLENILDMIEVVSPTGMQQLYDMVGGNTVTVRSAKFIFNGDISGTVVFTNQWNGQANLFYFVIRNWDARNSYSWKIRDMKMMYGGYGPPKDFVGDGSDFEGF